MLRIFVQFRNLAITFSCAALVVALCTNCFANYAKKTRLRTGKPKVTTITNGARVYLDAVEVVVHNVGRVDAEEIVVNVRDPNGDEQRLDGPELLFANEKATYQLTERIDLYSNKKVKIIATCSNCR